MVDFGDEFTIESYRIPWLIWIQLLVLVLLIFLLYCFSFLASDHSDRAGASPSTSQLVSRETQIEKKPIPKNNTTTVVTNCLEISQVWFPSSFFAIFFFNMFLFPVFPPPNPKSSPPLFHVSNLRFHLFL
jgi:Na+-transporting methylmalonyl-CoA/oxaloacetate decarboxylase gamma subunit